MTLLKLMIHEIILSVDSLLPQANSNVKHWFSTDDHSRVLLEKKEGDPTSDYINASYIPVSKGHSIATLIDGVGTYFSPADSKCKTTVKQLQEKKSL